MAFASANTLKTVYGNKRVMAGTFTNGAGDVGGSITTGLKAIDTAKAVVTSHVGAYAPKLTYSTSAGTLTIACDENVDGKWEVAGW